MLPTSFIVGPWEMTIVRDDAALYRLERELGAALAGNNTDEGMVWLREDESLTDDALRVDLMHELIHLCINTGGDARVDDGLERLIDLIAIALLSTLRNPRNALLRRFLFEE